MNASAAVTAVTRSRVIPAVVQQHADECANLCRIRSVLVGAAGVTLAQLQRVDDRLEAHLDGLEIAGEAGAALCDAALADPGPGEVFTSTVLALRQRDARRLDRSIALAEALEPVRDAVVLALEWTPPESLRGVTSQLLDAPHPLRRQLAVAACDLHRVDPGDALAALLADADAPLRAQALRAAGHCGRQDLAAACVHALSDPDPACRFWAAHSAVLLGERHAPLRPLLDATLQPGPWRGLALSLLFKLADAAQAAPLFQSLLGRPGGVRDAIRGAGAVGDPQAVPWLVAQMQDTALARLAGEAFCVITGLDLALHELERKPPDDAEAGPGDDPDDTDVAMDEDEGLPWPDPEKIQAWWQAHGHGFASGARHFMGEPPSWAHSLRVLRGGEQRRRVAAAQYLCLLRPGSRLFPTAAPAWRQRRGLDAMQP